MKTNLRTALSVMLLWSATMLCAQQKIELQVWPDGAPNTNGITEAETEKRENRPTNITSPTLTVYVAKNGNGKAIVACPGGGYVHLAMDHEGHDMAAWFNAQGITYAVLKYRMPNEHHDVPLSDALQAIRIMREHSQEWGINKIGIKSCKITTLILIPKSSYLSIAHYHFILSTARKNLYYCHFRIFTAGR